MKKRMWIAAGAIAIALTSCTAAIAAAAGSDASPASPGDVPPEGPSEGWVLTSDGGRLAVYRGGACVLRTDVDASTLRRGDRELVENGIEVYEYDEVLRLLEDFGA